jgi:Ca2+-transporting ATPase
MHWHSISTDETLKETGSSKQGLTTEAAKEKLQKHGRNELTAKKKKSPFIIFLQQFFDVMILVLAVAAVISFFAGEIPDAFVIIVIIILNAVVGFVQEYRAEKAMEALQKMAVPLAVVMRNNKTIEIPSPEIVPGDIVLLEAGNMVPADIRLLEVHSLKADEASLTGESNAVDKTTNPIKEKDVPPGDKTNMVFKGTVITNGRGKGVAVATGMKTELGKIAGMLQEKESATPLQKRMADFSKKLTVIIIIVCAVIFGAGYLRGENLTRMLLTAISVAVAAIPEALPAVITISLALGAKKLITQNVLIRKLHAVETLGSVTYICSDKTGTLTKNQMTVKGIWGPDEKERKELIKAMSLNHDVKKKEDNKELTGDPTEVAMVIYAREHEHYEKSWEEDHPRENELPFDAERKAMSTIHRVDNKYIVITKGALEALAGMSVKADKDKWKEQEEKMAQEGMRVIAFAAKEINELPKEVTPEIIENDLEFLGLIGLIDPPREEAKEAIKECKTAGIIPVMITGDHPLTAAAIARELGILENKEQKVIAGTGLSGMSEEEFQNEVEQIRVYARVSPEQKLNIVKALQQKGHFVAMTGDGVNDAPSLRKANIGIAMGITGTDVTQEAAHMILLDDNFATIVKAVKQGRRIFDNIRKFIKYIMTGNSAEIWTIFLAPFFGLPIPLLPVHILWINLVTDGLPALALATEPAEKDIMKRKPRKTNESIFSGGLGLHVIWVGVLMGLLSIGVQWYEINTDDKNWQTIVFTTLCFSQLWHVMAIRSEIRSLFSQGIFSNKSLLGSVAITVLLQFIIIYVPQLNSFFHTSPLTWIEMLTAIAISSIVFWAVEIEKGVKRRRLD